MRKYATKILKFLQFTYIAHLQISGKHSIKLCCSLLNENFYNFVNRITQTANIMAYYGNILEEELKNKVARDYFAEYDNTQIIGKIDFCIAIPRPRDGGGYLFETESLMWAEAKSGAKKDIYESFVQLILTIGRARTFDKFLPPAFLGAFDADKIGFLPYNSVLDIFYQSDFNWNVTPSDHETKEFRQVYDTVKSNIENGVMLFYFGRDDKELRKFIKENFVLGKSRLSKVRINKNNFTSIYQKWLLEVKPTIGVNWDIAKQNNIISADFYLADILSEHNITLKEKLYVLLRDNHYELDRRLNNMGMFDSTTAQFTDKQVAHKQFWNRYNRPPKREYWDYIVGRRDLLVPQDVRERKGSFFTPQKWVELSQQYLADCLGEDWQDEYYIWDCAAGTGNLLNGLTDKYKIWASTLDQADVDVMRDRVRNGANLLESHIFRFDFLNDSFDLLPQELQNIINDEERRKRLIIYINPPYAEASTATTVTGTGKNKAKVATENKTAKRYKPLIKSASNELFAQFFIRVQQEITGCLLAEFSTLKILQAQNFSEFRKIFSSSLEKIFVVPAATFDNVKGQFPIGFMIWNTGKHVPFTQINADIYDEDAELIGHKNFYGNLPLSINKWITQFNTTSDVIGQMSFYPPDFQNNGKFSILIKPQKRYCLRIGALNLKEISIYFSVRYCIEATWLNDRDQFLYPNDGWQSDKEFQNDCLAFTLFHGQNRISSKDGTNNWIPFTEQEVDAKDVFASHFMTDYINGRLQPQVYAATDLFNNENAVHRTENLQFSGEATALFDSGRALWRYYHAQPGANPNASLYDIREHFQGRDKNGRMNNDSNDEHYMELIGELRRNLKLLAKKIEPKVYEYGFLKR